MHAEPGGLPTEAAAVWGGQGGPGGPGLVAWKGKPKGHPRSLYSLDAVALVLSFFLSAFFSAGGTKPTWALGQVSKLLAI